MSLGGATEASIWSIYYPVHEVDPESKSIPYGRPLANQRFHVLDADLAPCPVWVTGELYIGGIGLAIGYWRDPEKTDARFILHPETGERLYRTGDWGRYLPDGDIEFLGRDDLQVKVQGHRIEIAEVEAALLSHPVVGSCAVAAVGERGGDKSLVAYLVPRESGETNGVPSHPVGTRQTARRKNGSWTLRTACSSASRNPGCWRRTTATPCCRSPRGPAESLDRLYFAHRRRQAFRRGTTPPRGPHRLARKPLAIHDPRRHLPEISISVGGRTLPCAGLPLCEARWRDGPARWDVLLSSQDARLADRLGRRRLESSIHVPANQQLFDSSAFSVFLVGQLQAIAPMYGTLARDFCLLEAGYIGQLLCTAAPPLEIGLCPIGACRESPVREALELEDSQILLHSFLGGLACPDAVDAARTGGEAPPVMATPIAPLRPPGIGPDRNGASAASAPCRPAAGHSSLIEDVRRFLRGKLPAYMVPTAYVVLDSLPLTGNGKVNRQSLPAPGQARPAPAETALDPATELERGLQTIIRQLTGRPEVGLDDNFFDLGINSLGIVRIHRRICELARKELEIADVFRHSSIRLLAEFLARTGPPCILQPTLQRRESWSDGISVDTADSTYLVEIRGGSQRRPILYFLPDFTGDLAGIYPLVGAVNPDFPCYGLRPRIRPEDDPALWPREWADRYAASILERHPGGPYFFVGHSLGGAFALELAQRLLESGYGPVAVTLLDSRPTGSRHERAVVRNLPLLRLLQTSDASSGSGLQSLMLLLASIERAVQRGDLPPGLDSLAVLQQLSAAECLVGREYGFPVLLLRAETGLPSDVTNDEDDFGWNAHCRGAFDVRLVPGDHSTMLTPPNVSVVADRLEDWLDRIENHRPSSDQPGTEGEGFVAATRSVGL